MIVRVAPYRLGRMGLGVMPVPIISGGEQLPRGAIDVPTYINPLPTPGVPTSDGTTPITSTVGSVSPIPTPGISAQSPATVVVTPTSGAIPSPSTVAAATSTPDNPLMDLLTGAPLFGIPNWVLLGAGLLFLMKKK